MANPLQNLPTDTRRQVYVGAAAALVGMMLYASKPGEAAVETSHVAAVRCDLPLGKDLSEKCLTGVDVPTEVAGDFLSFEQGLELVGVAAMQPLAEGQRLVPSMFPSGSVLDAKDLLGPGQRSLELHQVREVPQDVAVGSTVELLLRGQSQVGTVVVIGLDPLTVAIPQGFEERVTSAGKDLVVAGCMDGIQVAPREEKRVVKARKEVKRPPINRR